MRRTVNTHPRNNICCWISMEYAVVIFVEVTTVENVYKLAVGTAVAEVVEAIVVEKSSTIRLAVVVSRVVVEEFVKLAVAIVVVEYIV